MKNLPDLLGENSVWRIVVTDSGLGGLSICAGLEGRLRDAAAGRAVRLIYVNAWPDAGGGYNDVPDPAARAAVLDKALAAMTAFGPGLVVIACNTLSVLYERTAFSRNPAVPVAGIIEDGVDLFAEALAQHPGAKLVLFGTRTTIESGEHIRRLVRRGIDVGRLRAVSSHGLAAAIDKDPDSPALPGLVEECVARALADGMVVGTLLAGLCCSHYALIAGMFRSALERRTGTAVEVLDPNARLVERLTSGLSARRAAEADIEVEVVSKVELSQTQRRAVARRIELLSPRTARALLEYRRVPDLF